MADPISAGIMVATQLAGGIAARSQSRREARAMEESGRQSIYQGEMDALQSMRDERLASGAALASSAADGMALGTGTIQDLIEANARARNEEISNIRAKATSDAKAQYQGAKDARAAGNMALLKGVAGAAATVAGSINQKSQNAKVDAANARRRASELGTGRGILPGDQPTYLPQPTFGTWGKPNFGFRRFGNIAYPGN